MNMGTSERGRFQTVLLRKLGYVVFVRHSQTIGAQNLNGGLSPWGLLLNYFWSCERQSLKCMKWSVDVPKNKGKNHPMTAF